MLSRIMTIMMKIILMLVSYKLIILLKIIWLGLYNKHKESICGYQYSHGQYHLKISSQELMFQICLVYCPVKRLMTILVLIFYCCRHCCRILTLILILNLLLYITGVHCICTYYQYFTVIYNTWWDVIISIVIVRMV